MRWKSGILIAGMAATTTTDGVIAAVYLMTAPGGGHGIMRYLLLALVWLLLAGPWLSLRASRSDSRVRHIALALMYTGIAPIGFVALGAHARLRWETILSWGTLIVWVACIARLHGLPASGTRLVAGGEAGSPLTSRARREG